MKQEAIDKYNEGYRYYTGTDGYPLNYDKAFKAFKESADLGYSDAMNYLGSFYEDGEIVTQDYSAAVNWFYKAIQADSSNADAAYNLGRMYYLGLGVKKDMLKAYEFCNAAVELGLGNKHSSYPKSCFLTGCIIIEYFKNEKEAYPYFVDAAKYGNIPEAWYNLGWLSERGVIPVKDPGNNLAAARDGMAIGFYKEAANLGYVAAMGEVGRLYDKNNMSKEARPWLEKAASLGYEPSKKLLKLNKWVEGGSIFDLFS